MQFEVHVNYKDTGRDSEDCQLALFDFATSLVEPFGARCKAKYSGLGGIDIQVITIPFYRTRRFLRKLLHLDTC